MEIKKSGAHPAGNWLFTSKRNTYRFFMGLVVFAVFVVLCFGVLGLGAAQNKTAAETFFRPDIYRIAHFNFSPLKDAIDGKKHGIEPLRLSLLPNDLLKMEEGMGKIVKAGKDVKPFKGQSYNGKLSYRGKVHKVKLRLEDIGDTPLNESPGWVIGVEVLGNGTLEGMRQFQLLLPFSGAFMSNWLAIELMKERAVASTIGTFVNIAFNDSPYRTFYLEERPEQSLTHQTSSEAILFEIEDNDIVFCDISESGNPEFSETQKTELRQKWLSIMHGNLPIGTFFDMEKMGKLIAHMDLFNQKCPFQRKRVLFSYNPATGMVEPLATNFNRLPEPPSSSMQLFIESSNSGNPCGLRLIPGSWVQMIHENLDFQRSYLSEAEVISRRDVIGRLLNRNGNQLTYLLNEIYPQWPALELPPAAIYSKAKYMRSVLFPDVKEITAHLSRKANDYLEISLQNHGQLPLEVKSLSWRDTIFFYPPNEILLGGEHNTNSSDTAHYTFQFPRQFIWADSLASELVVNYRTPGLKAGNKLVPLLPWPPENSRTNFHNPAARNPSYRSFDFVLENEDKNIITIPAGAWTVSSDFVVPVNKRLQIDAGAEIDLINNSKIISYSPVYCLGREENPVVIKSSDKSGQGLIVIGARQPSELSHTNFSQLSNPNEGGWYLTGAVTFYESPVAIRNCDFVGNISGDDFLNIVRSDFTMDQVVFKNVLADAFDCDFCQGSIKNAVFSNIGNDGVDVSGTTIEISRVFMEFIGDKGLSAGEDSELKAEGIEIQNSEIGVTSKDRSRLFLSDSKLTNVKVAMTIFEKKSEFGPAIMNAQNVTIQQSKIPYLVEQNSTLTVDGTVIPTSRNNVKEILYGAEFGKSSK